MFFFKGTLCIQICEGEAQASPAAARAERHEDPTGSTRWSLNDGIILFHL